MNVVQSVSVSGEHTASETSLDIRIIRPGAAQELRDARPLLSQYLLHGHLEEGLTLREIVFDAGKRQLLTTWFFQTPYPSPDRFHLASNSAFLITQQSAVLFCMLDLDFKKKCCEVWAKKVEMQFLAPITTPNDISCRFGCTRQERKKAPSTPGYDSEATRVEYDFLASINKVCRMSGSVFLDLPPEISSSGR